MLIMLTYQNGVGVYHCFIILPVTELLLLISFFFYNESGYYSKKNPVIKSYNELKYSFWKF